MITPEDFKRVNNDINGNPRYVCHFLQFITDKDTAPKGPSETTLSYKNAKGKRVYDKFDAFSKVEYQYKLAISRARRIGGKKYNNKSYGGGIVFQSYNLQDLCNHINEALTSL